MSDNFRPTLSLDGEWSFHFSPEDSTMTPVSGTISVPSCWECAFPELTNKAGIGTYERPLSLLETFQGKQIFLCFDAADYFTTVRINGLQVGSHEGGYIPFEFNVTEFLHAGDNLLTVEIADSTTKEDVTCADGTVIRFAEIPHGKQSWYSSIGGLWQSVRLEARSEAFLTVTHFLPDIDAQTIAVQIAAHNADGCDVGIEFDVPEGAGAVESLNLALGQNMTAAVHSVPNPALWSPESPALYTAHLTLTRNGEVLDKKSVRFGMRKVESRDGYVCLNNAPYFLIGALDQAFYPKTRYTPPSEDYLRDQFLKAKAMGLNLMRCHIKVPTESYLHLCDEIGLLVWYELPNGKELTRAFRKRARQTLAAMWERDASHPCIIIATIMNESWGIDLTDHDQREWLKETYPWAKQQFPQWLIVDNSPCLPNYHVEGDLDDYHIYYNIPDHAAKWTEWVTKFAQRKAGTWSTYGDATKTGKEPLLISEFGNWGLPNWDNVIAFESEQPYWMQTRTDQTRADGFLKRFEEQRLVRAFADYNALADASQEQEWIALKFEIEQMRSQSEVGGYVITEFSDIDWEANGLLDMGRNPKCFFDRLPDVQAQDIVFPWLEERGAFFAEETRSMPIYFSQFSQQEYGELVLEWHCEQFAELSGHHEAIRIPNSGKPSNHLLAEISLRAPHVDKATQAVIDITLRTTQGEMIAHNTQNLVFVPQKIAPKTAVTLWLDDPTETEGLDARLRETGYAVQLGAEGAEICLATRWQDEVVEWVQSGGKAILAITDRKSLTSESGLGFGVQDRRRSSWGGDWCTSKTWFVPQRFPSLPDPTRIDFEYEKLTPRYVLTGVQTEDIWSGIFVGWLNYPAALVARLPIGKGELLITTFNLLPHLGDDPMATLLLNDLVALLRPS